MSRITGNIFAINNCFCQVLLIELFLNLEKMLEKRLMNNCQLEFDFQLIIAHTNSERSRTIVEKVNW